MPFEKRLEESWGNFLNNHWKESREKGLKKFRKEFYEAIPFWYLDRISGAIKGAIPGEIPEEMPEKKSQMNFWNNPWKESLEHPSRNAGRDLFRKRRRNMWSNFWNNTCNIPEDFFGTIRAFQAPRQIQSLSGVSRKVSKALLGVLEDFRELQGVAGVAGNFKGLCNPVKFLKLPFEAPWNPIKTHESFQKLPKRLLNPSNCPEF